MNFRGLLLIGAVVGAGLVAGAAACSGPDPGALTFSTRPSSGVSEPQGTDSGAAAATDAGVDAGPDPIFGTTAFAYVNPGVNANAAADEHAGTVEGKDCMVAGCHLDGAKVWVFGGTLYSSADGGAPVARGEVKVVGPNGVEIAKAYTDANGNFWVEKAGTTIPAGSKVGVRKEGGGKPRLMATGLQPGDSGCSKGGTCHGGQTGKVFAD